MTQWCGCQESYRLYAPQVDMFMEHARRGEADCTHAALLLMVMHQSDGLFVERVNDRVVRAHVIGYQHRILFTVERDLSVSFHVRRDEERGERMAMELGHFLEGHLDAIGAVHELNAEQIEASVEVDVWDWSHGDIPGLRTVSKLRTLAALLDAVRANAARVPVLTEFLPVCLVPELAAEYAYMSGDAVLRRQLATVPRQRTLYAYFKKRKRED